MIPFAHTSFYFHEDNIQWFISNNLRRVWLRYLVVSLGSVRQKWDTQCWKLISVTWNQDGFGHDHSWRQECWLSSRSITQPHQLWIRSLLSLLGLLPQLRGRNLLFSGREPKTVQGQTWRCWLSFQLLRVQLQNTCWRSNSNQTNKTSSEIQFRGSQNIKKTKSWEML